MKQNYHQHTAGSNEAKVKFCNQFFPNYTRQTLAKVGPKHLTHSHAMSSPLGPALANAFLVYFEKNWLQNCPSNFKN